MPHHQDEDKISKRHQSRELAMSSSQARRQVTSSVADAMMDVVAFDEDSTLVMDYACGSGALSQRLAPYCKSIVGVDINPTAIDQFNLKVANQGIPAEEMRGICIDLMENPDALAGKLFDVIVCSQSYHHFSSIEKTTKLLASFLQPRTGILLVSDLLKGPHADEFRCTHNDNCSHPRSQSQSHPHSHSHEYSAVVHRGGLTESEIKTSLEQAGLMNTKVDIIETIKKDGREIDIFLAQGVRPADSSKN